jgi:DNA-binding transcriptional regulator YhcF (GntR family)
MQPSISARIAASLDPGDPSPLYHQLAAVVRWEISHGRLPIGSMLPPVRSVAAEAGVNYHTVRRAWADLEREGVISQRRGRGAQIVRAPARVAWSPAGPATTDRTAARVWVVAASLAEAAHLAGRVADRWLVEAIPWPLEANAPPPGPMLCTGPVHPAALDRWPDREGDLRSLATVLDQATLGVLRRNAALLAVSRVIIHGDSTDPAVRELQRQLPRLGLQTALAQESGAGTEPEAKPDALMLYFPDAWAALDWGTRMQPHAVAAELGWAAGPLAGVAREQGWVGR